MKSHLTDKYEFIRSKEKLNNVHKLKNMGYGMVLYVCLGPVQMYLCIKYGGSIINYTGRRGKSRKNKKGCH